MIKRKTNKIVLLIVVVQIILLVNMITADSYTINQINKVIEELQVSGAQTNLINNQFVKKESIILNLLKAFFSIKQIGIVSADDFWNCCPETNDGAKCQDVQIGYTDCKETVFPTLCDQDSRCKKGCCIDETEGLCTAKSPKQGCESGGGRWDNSQSCAIQECVKGCCVLGDESVFTTEMACGKISSLNGFTKDFRDINSEIDCLAFSASQKKGSCILSQSCSLKTESECLSNHGEFFENYLCSSLELETNCTKQESISCVEGKDKIYWFDSCGNQENIYSSDRDSSWNNGMIISKEESCNSNINNADSKTCGNCNYFLGSKCALSQAGETKVQDGDYVCRDVNCIDETGRARRNGESWCVYDGCIGEGKDTVGSRHWKRMCIDGEIKNEGCSDYRGQLCAQSEIEEDGEKFTIASCVMNEAARCIGYTGDDMESKCKANKDCMLKHIDVSESFEFDVCVPNYPKGFDLTSSSGENSDVCSIASRTCTVIYEKSFTGDWVCEHNCDCEDQEFANQMSDFCISLGDCGSNINYIGAGTDNSRVTGVFGGSDPFTSWTKYQGCENPIPGRFVEPKDFRMFLGAMMGTGDDFTPSEAAAKTAQWLGGITGASGTLMALGTTSVTIAGSSTVPAISATTTLGGFAGVSAGVAIGAAAGHYLAESLGMSGDGALSMVISGAVAGGLLGYAAVYWGASYLMFTPWTAVGLAILIIFYMTYTAIVGWGKTREVDVKFECNTWQAPTGGDDCEKCNEDSLRPCTKYRCESLGQACKILNQEEENPPCRSIPREVNPPIISLGNISVGYSFIEEGNKKVRIKSVDKDDGCIQEFTTVLFSLKTDEFAQCKFDMQPTSSYREMSEFPIEQNSFTEEHTFAISMPSLDSFNIYNVSGDLSEAYGNMNLFIRCQDYFGNFNLDEYLVNFCINSGPDLTAPIINRAKPVTGSYLEYRANQSELTIYLNEPAECKYDVVEDLEYGAMSNSMQCKTDITDSELYGWPCSTTLTNLSENVNTFYFKCKDQPWINDENYVGDYTEADRNINQEDYSYTIYITESKLEIGEVSPEGDIEAGFAPLTVNLQVQTSGGMDNGKARCEYKWGENWVQFAETFSDTHKQRELHLLGGDFNIPIRCEDDAENIAESKIIFSTIVDESPPEIVRAYRSGGDLKIITDEKAECYYDSRKCNFNFDNATSMTTALSTSHTTDWIEDKTYYIKCADIWNNKNIGCAIIVKPGSV